MPRFPAIVLIHALVLCLGDSSARLGAARSVMRTHLTTDLAPQEGAAQAPVSLSSGAGMSDKVQLEDILQIPRKYVMTGDRVYGRYSNGEWYPATVQKKNADGSYLLRWDDGDDRETTKSLDEIRKKIASQTEISIGDRVEGKYANGKWYSAVVQQKYGDGSFLLGWADGDGADRRKHLNDIRASQPEAPPPVPQSSLSATQKHSPMPSHTQTQSGAERQSLTGTVATTVLTTLLLALHC